MSRMERLALGTHHFAERREAMVAQAIAARGIRSELVLGALRSVPREAFLPAPMAEFAYEDSPLPIAAGQTISQPYVVALMVEALALEGGENVLEIGTGSGYSAAVLARIAANVYTVERVAQLAEKAASTLAGLGVVNVHVRHADGTHGWADHAPYDAIAVAAGAPVVPESLKRQLRIGGRLVIPIGTDVHVQELVRVTRVSCDEYESDDEFYRMRARISQELIEKKGFSFVAIEGDWPDAARIDHYVRHAKYSPSEWTAFARFPTWMWRNREVADFVEWLRKHNAGVDARHRIAFHGLDLYSLYNSIRAVVRYLDDVDPATAHVARHRYACLTPWQSDPAVYGHAALTGRYQSCEREVVSMLTELLERERAYAERDGERFLDATQNARLVADAERYYRIMYYASRASWNIRDTHMFETLSTLLAFHGGQSKAIVWAHNSHVGDASATEMSARGEFNIGELCRNAYGPAAYAIGFGMNGGTVAAAPEWDGPMEVKRVRPALAGSYEALFHEAGDGQWLMPLRAPLRVDVVPALAIPLLERAIGVIYRPRTERESHYFEAVLPKQFDEYVWFDATTAIAPLATHELHGLPDTYPFGV